jgi:hypothetical protein
VTLIRLKQSAQNISEPLGHHGYFKGEEILACEGAGIARCVRRNILMKLRIMKIDRAADVRPMPRWRFRFSTFRECMSFHTAWVQSCGIDGGSQSRVLP